MPYDNHITVSINSSLKETGHIILNNERLSYYRNQLEICQKFFTFEVSKKAFKARWSGPCVYIPMPENVCWCVAVCTVQHLCGVNVQSERSVQWRTAAFSSLMYGIIALHLYAGIPILLPLPPTLLTIPPLPTSILNNINNNFICTQRERAFQWLTNYRTILRRHKTIIYFPCICENKPESRSCSALTWPEKNAVHPNFENFIGMGCNLNQ
ncbi:hypothetical protein HELRODRAFT_169372 [Helobdella robusta]|uniref:Uncharacterized protein n=1 Tax=Helobdella robusta TaxID=6412 RepID=T1F1V2_HELRO|nr:hypothetical protein HELRODRAFT_169372 [Helobdella robusta]ESO08511.1 hypothetical protein HELRODRAFT_169372 [Helobdella robusta]